MEKSNFAVLVVDDEEIVREGVKRILSDEGFDVLLAADGKTAIDTAKNRHFDAALLDIKLPDISGVEVLEQIKVYKPDVQTVMMTAYDIKEQVSRAFELGINACLHKPFEIKRLLEILKEMRKNGR
jgi:CheY-like chemotaxis protein